MMRQNLALVLAMTFATATGTAMADTKKSSPGHKRLEEMHSTQENLDELNSSNQLEDDKPVRQVYKAPPPTYAPVRAKAAQPQVQAPRPNSQTARQQPLTGARTPASVAPMRAAVVPIFPVAAITFDEYVNENARNPALSKKIDDHQLAFTDVSAPAVISIPGSESEKAATAAAAAPGAAGAPAGANTAAIQAAAAAAAAAGIIPAGTTLPSGTGGSYGTSAPAAGGPVR